MERRYEHELTRGVQRDIVPRGRMLLVRPLLIVRRRVSSMKHIRMFAFGIGLLALAGVAVGTCLIADPTVAFAGCSGRC